MLLSAPRLVVAGLAGDSGKTLVTLGVARALTAAGRRVGAYKKGPDYIDAAWLGAASRSPGRNLDTFLMRREGIGDALARGLPADLLLVEGNRGLHDGVDAEGSHSTAELAKLLAAPVVLVVDVTKMTRTAAALVMGCALLDPEVRLAGVILNRVGTARHERVIREAFAHVSGPPVLGAVPRLEGDLLPGRHLGLVTPIEHPAREEALRRAAAAVQAHVDLDALLRAARTAPVLDFPDRSPRNGGRAVRIGVFRDEAFSFYYPENLEALEEAGASLAFVSPLRDHRLPEVDALYFGGGFPEVHVEQLAGNCDLLGAVRAAVTDGMPAYAECGGLMYLARELIVGGVSRAMVGALDISVEQTTRPQGHGYVEAEVDRPNPFFPPGTRLRGHEFHYSQVTAGGDAAVTSVRLHRGRGVGDGRDGMVAGRVWASYLHIHSLGVPTWATSFAALARVYGEQRSRGSHGGDAHGIGRGGQEVAAAGA